MRTSFEFRVPNGAGCAAILMLLSCALYAGTLFNGFVYDDASGVLSNPYIQNFSHLREIFTTTVFSFQGEEGASNYYRPLFHVPLLVVHSVFGELPLGYHLFNVMMNAIVVALVFAVGRELLSTAGAGVTEGRRQDAGGTRVAFVAATIFALHPVHTEPVAFIACNADLELAALCLAAFWCYLRLGEAAQDRRNMEDGKWKRAASGFSIFQFLFSNYLAAWLHAGMLASFALALLAKEPAMVLPALVIFYEHACRGDRCATSLRTKLARYAGLWLVAGAYVVFRFMVVGGFAPLVKHPEVTWRLVPLNALALLWQYAAKLVWPWPLSVAYPFEAVQGVSDPRALAGACVLLAGVALLVMLWRRSRTHAFALVWIVALLAPALNPRWMATYVFAERNLYLASAGFAWVAASAAMWLWRREGAVRVVCRGAVVLLAAICAVLATYAIVIRNRDWRDDYTLFCRTLETHPHAAHIRSNLGAWYWSRGRMAEAEREWMTVLAYYDPQNPFALSNLGLMRLEQGQLTDAEYYVLRALELRPKFAAARVHLARVRAAQGRGAEAEAEFRRAIELNKWSTQARNFYGRFLLDAGRLEEAAAQFRASQASIPNEAALVGLAEIAERQNSPAEAERAWGEVLRLSPYNARAHFALAKIYLAAGRTAEARRALEAGLLMDPTNAEAQAALAKLRMGGNP